jgi:hypothetical protein
MSPSGEPALAEDRGNFVPWNVRLPALKKTPFSLGINDKKRN